MVLPQKILKVAPFVIRIFGYLFHYLMKMRASKGAQEALTPSSTVDCFPTLAFKSPDHAF